jgi:hypothetical protein
MSLILTSNAGWCSTRTDLIVKFSVAMGGVIVASIVIWLGLTVYNKIIEDKSQTILPEDEILTTPKTVDEAVKFFINKNRLR